MKLAQSVSQSVSQSVIPPAQQKMRVAHLPINRAQEFARSHLVFKHRAAKAKCTMEHGIFCIGYSGAITPAVMDTLEQRILPMRYGMPAVLERMDTAVLAWTGPFELDVINYPTWTPPSAVIVPPEQFSRAAEFCEVLGRLGVLRTVWLPQHLDHARRWALTMAANA